MRRMSFALALMAVLAFGGLLIETASAQNANSSRTMNSNMGGHALRHQRQPSHRRHRRHNMNKAANGNANH